MMVQPPWGEILQWSVRVLDYKKLNFVVCMFSDDQLSVTDTALISSGQSPRIFAWNSHI